MLKQGMKSFWIRINSFQFGMKTFQFGMNNDCKLLFLWSKQMVLGLLLQFKEGFSQEYD